MKQIIMMAIVALTSISAFGYSGTKNCTLSSLEQASSNEYYRSLFNSTLSFSVDLSFKKSVTFTYSLSPVEEIMNGEEQVVAFDLKQDSSPSSSSPLKITFENTGVDILSGLASNSTVWDKTGVQMESIMYELPNNRLAIAVLVCRNAVSTKE